jgi:hypothetical protein
VTSTPQYTGEQIDVVRGVEEVEPYDDSDNAHQIEPHKKAVNSTIEFSCEKSLNSTGRSTDGSFMVKHVKNIYLDYE